MPIHLQSEGFFQLTPDERADIARAILERAVRHARRRKKAAMWTLPAGWGTRSAPRTQATIIRLERCQPLLILHRVHPVESFVLCTPEQVAISTEKDLAPRILAAGYLKCVRLIDVLLLQDPSSLRKDPACNGNQTQST